eukprot:30941-Pelagococcus_subviridis.AAC.15
MDARRADRTADGTGRVGDAIDRFDRWRGKVLKDRRSPRERGRMGTSDRWRGRGSARTSLTLAEREHHVGGVSATSASTTCGASRAPWKCATRRSTPRRRRRRAHALHQRAASAKQKRSRRRRRVSESSRRARPVPDARRPECCTAHRPRPPPSPARHPPSPLSVAVAPPRRGRRPPSDALASAPGRVASEGRWPSSRWVPRCRLARSAARSAATPPRRSRSRAGSTTRARSAPSSSAR